MVSNMVSSSMEEVGAWGPCTGTRLPQQRPQCKQLRLSAPVASTRGKGSARVLVCEAHCVQAAQM